MAMEGDDSFKIIGEFVLSRTQWISSQHNVDTASYTYNASFSLTELVHEPKLD